MTHGSLFSGIGGFDLAAEWMGWENLFHCEISGFCQRVLKKYWPNATSYADITTTDFSQWRGKCDVVSGGFPCQPYSQAGKRKGKDDDRHLWPQMLRAIKEIQPAWVVGENVPGLLNWKRGMVLAEICADLEVEGFEVFPPIILPACGKNAPHRRDRLWIVAHAAGHFSNNAIRNERPTSREISEKRFNEPITFTNSASIGQQGSGRSKGQLCSKKDRSWKTSWADNDGGWPTQSPVCGRDDGVPDRMDRIKALGNAIVPQVVFEIFKAIEHIMKKEK
jgi:DNA (cytosine-5)-methyltransferase 1